MFDYDIIFVGSENNVVAHTTSDILNSVRIENWEMNRPPDMERIPEIQRSMRWQTYADGIVYLSVNSTGDGYICYDGIHRLTAIRNLKEKKDVIIDLILTYSEEKIISKFRQLNRCQPVPHLYTKSERNLQLKETIEGVVKELRSKYPGHFSASATPNIPNENRDLFINKLTELEERTDKINAVSNVEHWIKYLNDLNDFTKAKLGIFAPKLTPSQLSKCELSKWYLFAVKNWHIVVVDRYERDVSC
jgi:hypothetical protein